MEKLRQGSEFILQIAYIRSSCSEAKIKAEIHCLLDQRVSGRVPEFFAFKISLRIPSLLLQQESAFDTAVGCSANKHFLNIDILAHNTAFA